jgi:DNA polymerase-3 subunit epsilon
MIKLSKPIVFFDLETTGVSITSDKVVQVAITKIFPNGEIVNKTKFINPERPIPKEATEVHGISDDMVKDSPTFKQIAKALKDEFTGCDIGGFNSDNFDIPLLSTEFEKCGIVFPDDDVNLLDVLKIERIVNSHKLGETFKRYTGNDLENAHDASADTDATRIVFEHQIPKLLEILKTQNEDFDGELTIESIDKFCQGENERFDFAGKTYIKDGIVCWSFGKCKDKNVLDDRNYLNWVLSNDFPLETKNKLKSLLNK